MKIKIILISLIISIFSINSLFAGFQFHINPKIGSIGGFSKVQNDKIRTAVGYKENWNLQTGYGFQIGDGSNSLNTISLLLDFGYSPIDLLTVSEEQEKKNPQLISSGDIPAIYTGVALNFDFANNFLLGIALGPKFGFGNGISKGVFGGYGRITLGYKFFKTEKIALSAMFDIESEGYTFDKADYDRLFAIPGVQEKYATLSLNFGMGFQFGK